MNLDSFGEEGFEAERYELHSTACWMDASRRDFLRMLGGGLFFLCLDPDAPAQESGRNRRPEAGDGLPREIGAWLHIAEDGSVTAYTGKVEVGQNARTSLTQAVADELDLSMDSVRMVMGDTDRVPFDMGTFGSRTTPTMIPQLRRAAAAAREVILELAAARWAVDRGSLVISQGVVTHPGSKRSLRFGELTRGHRLVEAIGKDTTAVPAPRWKVAGHSVPKVDGRAFVTGRHRYTSDLERPGMMRGKVLRPPAFGSRLASLDSSKADKLSGVSIVHDGDFVGLVAPDEFTASRALGLLVATWNSPTDSPSSDGDLAAFLKKHSQTPSSEANEQRVSVSAGHPADEVSLQADYVVAYIAHAPLEPRAAVAEWDGDRLTVSTGTQRPFGVRTELAQAFGIPEQRVHVIVPDTGSGYGGKHTGDAAIEAARLAKAAGRPVKLVWTREEEFTWAYFRPAGLIEVSAAAQKDGKLTAWEFHNYNSGGSGLATPYAVPGPRVAFHAAKSPLRQGSYRALAATANHFARESMMDELAHKLGIDPLAFRLKNLENPRIRAVLEAASSRFGWISKPDPGRGFGLALGTEKGSYLATCVEAAVDAVSKELKIVRIVTAFECGAVLNPDHLRNQVEGAVVMGLGGALFEAIRFENGRILNARFSRYRVPRFGDIPRIEVILLDRKDLPSAGAGETPIVAIAPALAGAIFQASGVRLRSLPLVPRGTVNV